MMEIKILYRHYNIQGSDNRGRPSWFDYEKCFINFLDTIKDEENVDLHVVMDGNIEGNFIKKYTEYFTLHEIKAGGDQESFKKAHEIAKSLETKEDCLYYFLENDYLHLKGWVSKIRELFDTYSNLNYVSLYDHKDKYFLPMYENLVSKLFVTQNHHWRTTPSTCGSYIINKKIFLEDFEIPFQISGDHQKFLWLNENKNRFVITPIPGLSTHCMENLMSPSINWNKL